MTLIKYQGAGSIQEYPYTGVNAMWQPNQVSDIQDTSRITNLLNANAGFSRPDTGGIEVFNSYASLPSPSSFGVGVAQVGGDLYASDSVKINRLTKDVDALIIKTILDIPEITYWLDAKDGVLKSDYSAATSITDTVTFWQDKVAGLGANSVPTVSGTPKFDPTGINGMPAIKFNGTTDKYTTPNLIDNTYLTGNHATESISIFLVMKVDPTAGNAVPWSTTPATGSFFIESQGNTGQTDITAGISQLTDSKSNAINLAGFPIGMTEGVFGFNISSGKFMQYMNTLVSPIASSSTPVGPYSITAGTAVGAPVSAQPVTIGNLAGSFWFKGWISQVVIGKGLTAAKFNKVIDLLSEYTGYTAPTIVISSNSQASGSGTIAGATQSQLTGTTNIRGQLAGLVGTRANVRLDAYPGRDLKQLVSESSAISDWMVRPRLAKDICILWEATNQISTTSDFNLAAAKALTVKYCNDRKAAGFRYVAVCTALKRTDAGANNAAIEAMRLQYNSWLLANYTAFADKVIDFASDSRLDIALNPGNFNADNVHLNDAGSVIAASILYTAILGWL